MSGILNIGSLTLGLIAWMIPAIVMCKQKKKDGTRKFRVIGASFISCIMALLLQIFEIRHRVDIHDWTALLDTMDVLSGVAVILVMITVILNGIALKSLK